MVVLYSIWYVCVFFLGLAFGSFASVLITRLKHGKKGIFLGRSECPYCHHVLSVKDLIPLFSYIILWGKCAYCSKKLSLFYIAIESLMAIWFVLVSVIFTDVSLLFAGDMKEWIKWIFHIVCIFCTVVYVFYDILFLEIVDVVVWFLIGWIALFLLWDALFSFGVFPHFIFSDISTSPSFVWMLTFFWTIGMYGVIIFWWFQEKIDMLFLGILGVWLLFLSVFFSFHTSLLWNAVLSSYLIFIFFYAQYALSWGRWLWWGDLRIAVLVGLSVWLKYLFLALFISYLLGSVVWIVRYFFVKYSYLSKIQGKIVQKMSTILAFRLRWHDVRIPFWPFLAWGMYGIWIFWEFLYTMLFVFPLW